MCSGRERDCIAEEDATLKRVEGMRGAREETGRVPNCPSHLPTSTISSGAARTGLTCTSLLLTTVVDATAAAAGIDEDVIGCCR